MGSRNTFKCLLENQSAKRCSCLCLIWVDIACIIWKHTDNNGATPRKDGNVGRKTKHYLKYEDISSLTIILMSSVYPNQLPQGTGMILPPFV